MHTHRYTFFVRADISFVSLVFDFPSPHYDFCLVLTPSPSALAVRWAQYRKKAEHTNPTAYLKRDRALPYPKHALGVRVYGGCVQPRPPPCLRASLNARGHRKSSHGMPGRHFDSVTPPPLARLFSTPQHHALPFTLCASLRLPMFSVHTHDTHERADGGTPNAEDTWDRASTAHLHEADAGSRWALFTEIRASGEESASVRPAARIKEKVRALRKARLRPPFPASSASDACGGLPISTSHGRLPSVAPSPACARVRGRLGRG